MSYFIAILLAGFLGGVVRGLVGFIKHQFSYSKVEFRPLYFSLMMLISGLIGLLAAWVTEDLGITFLGMERLSPSLAVIIGYAGGDMIENLFKIITRKPDIFSLLDK